jgi:hypothetical protein
VGETDCAARELGVAEVDRAGRKLSMAEVAAVKDNAPEVEVQLLPGHHSVVIKMRGNDLDDSVADFAASTKGHSLRCGSGLARVGLVWHAQVGAQYVDAGLPVFLPVIRQARHGVHAGQPDGWLVAAELIGSRGETLIQRPGPLLGQGPVQLLALLR